MRERKDVPPSQERVGKKTGPVKGTLLVQKPSVGEQSNSRLTLLTTLARLRSDVGPPFSNPSRRPYYDFLFKISHI